MRKLSLIAIFLFSSSAFALNCNWCNDSIVVSSCIANYYTNGILTQTRMYGGDRNVLLRTYNFTYNSLGLNDSVIQSNRTSIIINKYSAELKLLSRTGFTWINNVFQQSHKDTFHYNSIGQLSKTQTSNSRGTVFSTDSMCYDLNDRIIKKYSFDSNAVLTWYYTYEYDSNLSTINEYSYWGNIDSLDHYKICKYDLMGNIVNEDYYPAKRTFSSVVYFQNSYDGNNLTVVKTCHISFSTRISSAVAKIGSPPELLSEKLIEGIYCDNVYVSKQDTLYLSTMTSLSILDCNVSIDGSTKQLLKDSPCFIDDTIISGINRILVLKLLFQNATNITFWLGTQDSLKIQVVNGSAIIPNTNNNFNTRIIDSFGYNGAFNLTGRLISGKSLANSIIVNSKKRSLLIKKKAN